MPKQKSKLQKRLWLSWGGDNKVSKDSIKLNTEIDKELRAGINKKIDFGKLETELTPDLKIR